MAPQQQQDCSVDLALLKLASALNVVANARVFGPSQFSAPHASTFIASLNARALATEVDSVGSAIAALDRLLAASGHHPLVKLVVQAACVKAVSQELWNDSPEEDSSDTESEGDSTCGGPADKESETEVDGIRNPLAGLPPAEMAEHLMEILKEVPGTRPLFIRHATRLGPEGVWEALQETKHQIATRGPLTVVASGERPRTAGGIFLKLAQAKVAKEQARAAVAAAPAFVLRPYQKVAVEQIAGSTCNWLVAAPTNTGKTAIFIEVTRRLMAAKPGATAVVVVPTVSLVRQQSAAYEKAGFRPATGPTNQALTVPAVDWFCGDKPLPGVSWRDEVARLGVIVIEAQSFANLLKSRAASLKDIQLLVLDECHHTGKDHPYALVMRAYHALPLDARPRVLGFSASPANGKTEEHVEESLERLLGVLDARLHVVADDDATVQQVAPAPAQEEQRVPPRVDDGLLQEWLRQTMHLYALLLNDALQAQMRALGPSSATRAAAAAVLGTGPPGVADVAAPAGEVQAYQLLCAWMNAAMVLAHSWQLPNLGQCVQVLEVLRRAEALCDDVGYECGLQYAAQRLTVMCAACTAAAKGPSTALATPGPAAPSPPRRTAPQHATELMATLEAYHSTAPSAAELEAASARAAGPLQHVPPCADVTLTAVNLCHLFLFDLATWDGRTAPLLHAISPGGLPALAARAAATLYPKGAAEAVAPLPPPSEICSRLVGRSTSPLLPGTLAPPPLAHPKVWALVQYLQRYRDREEFHGIIFCRSRQGAHFLVEVLRAATMKPQEPGARAAAPLAFVDDVLVFVGHGGVTDDKSRSIRGMAVGAVPQGAGTNLAARGMNVQQQQEVLEDFKGPGRRLLVATNAAEEGLDLPCCEFVVRFSPPASGIQRVQGRGRARKHGASYMCLVQDKPPGSLQHGGGDARLHKKSEVEEQHLRAVMARSAARQV